MATLIIHGTVPVKIPFTVKWWWDSWHEAGFLDAMAKAMHQASGTSQDDIWKVKGVPVARVAALEAQGPSGWQAALDPAAWEKLIDPRRYLDAEQPMIHQGCFMWSGSDMDSERQRAGRALAHYLNRIHRLAPDEPIRLVAHSHGCNVVKVASSSDILDPAIFIERAAFLACPHCTIERGGRTLYPYRLDPARFGAILNAYSARDTVQEKLAQDLPGPPEGSDMVMGIFRAHRQEQDPAAKGKYIDLALVTEDKGIKAHSAMHGRQMGALLGGWLTYDPDDFKARYEAANAAYSAFTIPAGDFGE